MYTSQFPFDLPVITPLALTTATFSLVDSYLSFLCLFTLSFLEAGTAFALIL